VAYASGQNMRRTEPCFLGNAPALYSYGLGSFISLPTPYADARPLGCEPAEGSPAIRSGLTIVAFGLRSSWPKYTAGSKRCQTPAGLDRTASAKCASSGDYGRLATGVRRRVTMPDGEPRAPSSRLEGAMTRDRSADYGLNEIDCIAQVPPRLVSVHSLAVASRLCPAGL
jgi:hypothetical protein